MRKRSERGEVQKREFFGGLVMTYDGVKLVRPRAIEDIWVDFTKDYVAKKKSGPLPSFVIVIFYVACSQFGLSSDLTTFMIAPFIFLHNK